MIGTTLGPYRIDKELGAGGMGRVYRASTVRPVAGLDAGATVALKVVHTHLVETEGFFKRFLREAQIGKRVVHENVVRTIDMDALSAGGVQHNFLVMEYVEGQTLRALLADLERIPEELCRHIGREVAKGLAAIHAAGVVHRDMKPENVLITGEHVVKVMDLGVARLNDEALRLSQTGAFVGSIHYAAPECFEQRGGKVDGRADLHALGLVLYELACGTNPYHAASVPEVLRRVLHEQPRRLGDVNPQLSPFFEEVVHCLLAKRPADRFADAATLLAVLEEGEACDWWRSRAKVIRAVTHQPLRRIRIPRETAVYGREKDLGRLHALYQKARAGEGQVVLIEGEAGIGKSRVVDELIGRLQRDGEDLHFLFGSYPPGGAATAAGAFSTAFHEQFGAEGSAAYLRPSPILVPAFDALLKREPPPPGVEALTSDSLQTCFVHALRGLADERTTVLLVDDLHFATEDARSLFTSLAMAVPGHRILLVGTTRPGVDEKWLAGITRLPQTSQVPLHRLGPKDLTELLQDSLKSESLALSLAGQIAQKSDGNPFFVFEIIQGLRDGQFLTQRADGTWVTTRVIEDIQIPSTILDLVNARVADLTDEERSLLDVAACWGHEFDPALVGSAIGLARIPALQSFGRIEKRHRLVRSAGRRYVFDHHQVQEALYEALNEQLREEYHAALASALETQQGALGKDVGALDGAVCVDLAEQFLRGARGVPALRYLEAALKHLQARYMTAAALRLVQRALAVPGLLVGEARVDLLLHACGWLEAAGRVAEHRSCAQEAAALADLDGSPLLRARAHRVLGHFLERAYELEAATTELTLALDLARSVGDQRLQATATNCLSQVLLHVGKLPEARQNFEHLLGLVRELGDRVGEASALVNLGNGLAGQGRTEEAMAYYAQAIELSGEIGHRPVEAISTMNLGSLLTLQGRLAEAKDRLERSLAISREIGNRGGEAIALVNLGPTWHALGDFGRAREALQGALAICRAQGDLLPEAYGLLVFGLLADEDGDAAEALRLMGQSLALRRSIGDGEGIVETLIAIADVHRRTGDVDAAREALEEALRLARPQGRPVQVARALAMMACLPGGDAGAAVAALEAAELGSYRAGVCFLLWLGTGDRTHLAAARRALDESLAWVPAVYHASMLTNVRVNREIVEAATAAGM